MTTRHKCPGCNFNKSYKIRRGKVTLLGIAAKGYVHRLVEHQKGKYTDKHGSHINGLEGFWGYLKRKLASKGGIRKERLPLYLAQISLEIQSHKDILSIEQQVDKILKLLYNHKKIIFSG